MPSTSTTSFPSTKTARVPRGGVHPRHPGRPLHSLSLQVLPDVVRQRWWHAVEVERRLGLVHALAFVCQNHGRLAERSDGDIMSGHLLFAVHGAPVGFHLLEHPLDCYTNWIHRLVKLQSVFIEMHALERAFYEPPLVLPVVAINIVLLSATR